MTPEQLNKLIDERALKIVRDYMQSSGFSNKKIADMPTDSLQVVNRKYLTLNGTTTQRPASSVVGQRYLDTTIGRPIYWSGSAWIDGAGSIS